VFRYGFWLLALSAFAADPVVLLEKANVDVHDKQSVLRGAHIFKTQCLSCHALAHWRYDDVAKEANITTEMMPSWPSDAWGGHPPPDLSLIALEIGVNKLYTYLTSYFTDTTRPTGANNLVYPNTSMPNVLARLQGDVYLKPGLSLTILANAPKRHWYQVVDFGQAGQLDPDAFDLYLHDIVSFLSYVADPSVYERHQLAPYVLGYLVLMMVLTYWWYRNQEK